MKKEKEKTIYSQACSLKAFGMKMKEGGWQKQGKKSMRPKKIGHTLKEWKLDEWQKCDL